MDKHPANRAGENKESGTNEITIKIVNGEEGKRYFIGVSTNGKQKKEILPGFQRLNMLLQTKNKKQKQRWTSI